MNSPAKVRSLLPWAALFLALYVIGHFLPEGFNWRLDFSQGNFPPWWVPWAKPLIALLNLPAVFALTMVGLAARSFRRNRALLPIALAVVSLPTLWTLFLGDVSGLPLIGLLILPWGIPLVLLKPQIAAFSLLSNWKGFIFATLWLAISVVIWGLWPLQLLGVQTPEWKALHPQDITLFPWGILLSAPLMWLGRRDEDLLMAAGSLATPHLFPYHFIVLMPALARMRRGWMWATWILTWSPLLANWLGPLAWHLGNLASLSFFAGIYLHRGKLRVGRAESAASSAQS
jgi:hypothetical protein